MSNINLGGGYSSAPKASQHWTLRDRLRNLTTALSGNASLDLRFGNQYYYKADIGGDPSQYAAMELMDATCARGSKGWYPEWDFTNGGVCGRLTEYAPNELRYGSQGLLEEASSTNRIRNPRCEGAVAGTPGTAPTNWGIVPASGVSAAVEGSGYENGWPYFDVRLFGTASASSVVSFEANGIVLTSPGQSWTSSFGVRIVGGTAANVSRVNVNIVETEVPIAYLREADGSSFVPTTSHQRMFTSVVTGANTGAVTPRLKLISSGAIDITLRIYAPQLEQASAPSSPILPNVGTPEARARATETVTSLASVSRTSPKSNAGEWDFTSGGAVGAYREYLPNVPAVTGKGLLVEEGSTNQIRNPRGEGAVAGTPGTAPTNWSIAAAGATSSIIGSGYENGWPYVDVKLSGAPTGNPIIALEETTQVVASTGQDWSVSVGARIVSGDLANVTGLGLRLIERTSGGSLVNANLGETFVPSTQHKRFGLAAALSGGGTVARVQPRLDVVWDGSGAIDITLRIYAPQLEQKAYPTSPRLPPKGAPGAATRAADRVKINNGAWSNDNGPGTLCVEAVFNSDGASGQFPRLATYGVDANNRLFLYRNQASGQILASFVDGGATQASMSLAPSSAGTDDVIRVATSWTTNDFALSANGATTQTDASGTVTLGAAHLTLGQNVQDTGALIMNGYLKQVRYFPTRKTDAELEALVGNS